MIMSTVKTPVAIIRITIPMVIWLVKGRRSPYPTVVMVSSTKRSDSPQVRLRPSRSGKLWWMSVV